jgi:hypothetical protein
MKEALNHIIFFDASSTGYKALGITIVILGSINSVHLSMLDSSLKEPCKRNNKI